MYCVKCGVELQKGAERCPLCGLRVYHPELSETPEAAPYPRSAGGESTVSHGGLLFIVSFLFVLPLIVCLMVDLRLNRAVTWSGYVTGGLLTAYIAICLPLWFRQPNPVIFFPCAMAAAGLLVLYICLQTGGRWFMSFALPIMVVVLLILETVIVLMRYTVGVARHRALYIFGGATIAVGALCVLIEFLLRVSFGIAMRWWSLYPLAVLFLLGMMLIIIAICRPLRESLHKKFFL